jgi:hypothetical protein
MNSDEASEISDEDERRAFDFWVGDWTVTENGEIAGTNRIVAELDGLVLSESWSGTSGVRGRSLSFFDRRKRHWHQTWIASDGSVLELDGGRIGIGMQLQGEGIDPATGARVDERITWTPNPDGTVRQHWQRRADAAHGWTTVFDGLYRRIANDREAPSGA